MIFVSTIPTLILPARNHTQRSWAALEVPAGGVKVWLGGPDVTAGDGLCLEPSLGAASTIFLSGKPASQAWYGIITETLPDQGISVVEGASAGVPEGSMISIYRPPFVVGGSGGDGVREWYGEVTHQLSADKTQAFHYALDEIPTLDYQAVSGMTVEAHRLRHPSIRIAPWLPENPGAQVREMQTWVLLEETTYSVSVPDQVIIPLDVGPTNLKWVRLS